MTTDVRVPDEQEGTRAVVRGWLKAVGDAVALNDPLVELETDKVTQEVPAPCAGVLSEILLESEAEAVPGAVLGRISEGAIASSPAKAGAQEAKPSDQSSEEAPSGAPGPMKGTLGDNPGDDTAPSSAPGSTELRLSPSVKRALLQNKLDPARLTGTGRDGRLTREDVDRAVAAGPTTADIPHDRMRLRIAENMVRAVTEAPHVTAVFEADFSAIAAHKAAFAAAGIKLSYTVYLVKAAADAMADAPAINGRWEADHIALPPAINIGIGTALGDKGLVVPVVRDVAALTLEQVAATLDELTSRARSGKLAAADVSGGTFTISNHGVSGSLLAAPIILHAGQAAILGVGKLEKRVVVRTVDGADSILIRPMAYVTLTIDHRVVDGHQTNAWLSRFVEIVESWPAA